MGIEWFAVVIGDGTVVDSSNLVVVVEVVVVANLQM